MPPATKLPSILWVTPCSVNSAIGRYSALVTRELARSGFHVTIAASDIVPTNRTTRHEYGKIEIVEFEDFDIHAQNHDLIIYNIGNNFNFHGRMLDSMIEHPGIGIFHDIYLYDLFYGYLSHKGQLNQHDMLVRALYGEHVALHPSHPFDAAKILEHRYTHYPMLKWLAPRVTGSVSHARFGCELLAPLSAGPVQHIPLAYSIDQWRTIKRKRLPRTAGKKRISVFGDINPNKRVDSIMRAIGSEDRLVRSLTLSLVGRIVKSEKIRLDHLAKELGIDIDIVGEADNRTYASYLLATDVVSCLRYPTTESASATAIEAMLAGKPVLVTDTGFYRDLPNDLVFKIAIETEQQSLVDALLNVIANDYDVVALSSAITTWAESTFTPAEYCRQIAHFITTVSVNLPLSATAFALGRTSSMLNLNPADPFVRRWAETADSIFQSI